MMNQYGIKTAEIYENDISQLAIQMNRFSPVMKSEIIFSDIIAAKPNQPHTLYDLDFCCSINNAVITTLSIRPVGFMHTILKYSELIDRKSSPIIEFLGKISNRLGKFRAYQLTTGSKKFMCYLYKDSAPMVTIQSIIY
jgi:hypothetical protein